MHRKFGSLFLGKATALPSFFFFPLCAVFSCFHTTSCEAYSFIIDGFGIFNMRTNLGTCRTHEWGSGTNKSESVCVCVYCRIFILCVMLRGCIYVWERLDFVHTIFLARALCPNWSWWWRAIQIIIIIIGIIITTINIIINGLPVSAPLTGRSTGWRMQSWGWLIIQIILLYYLPTYLSTCLSLYLPSTLPTSLSTYLSLPTFLPTTLPTYLYLSLSLFALI